MRMGDHPLLIGIPNKTLKGLVYSNVQNVFEVLMCSHDNKK
jgi:hypothetical protein